MDSQSHGNDDFIAGGLGKRESPWEGRRVIYSIPEKNGKDLEEQELKKIM